MMNWWLINLGLPIGLPGFEGRNRLVKGLVRRWWNRSRLITIGRYIGSYGFRRGNLFWLDDARLGARGWDVHVSTWCCWGISWIGAEVFLERRLSGRLDRRRRIVGRIPAATQRIGSVRRAHQTRSGFDRFAVSRARFDQFRAIARIGAELRIRGKDRRLQFLVRFRRFGKRDDGIG